MSSISDGFDELALPRRKSPAGWTLPPLRRSGVLTVLCNDTGATLDELREAVTVLEDSERTARRVFGGAHPLTACFEEDLRNARAALRARETE